MDYIYGAVAKTFPDMETSMRLKVYEPLDTRRVVGTIYPWIEGEDILDARIFIWTQAGVIYESSVSDLRCKRK